MKIKVVHFISIACIILYSCSFKNEIENIQYAIDPGNVLRIQVSFNTSRISDTYIEYWEVEDEIIKRSERSDGLKDHQITLIRLLPEKEYAFRILGESSDSQEKVLSNEFTIKTGSLPEELPSFNLVANEGDVFTGNILIRKAQNPGNAMLLDNQGRIVWYHLGDSIFMNPFSWTENNTFISLLNTDHLQEMDLYGNIVFELKFGEKGYDRHLHHEIRRIADNRIIALCKDKAVFDLSSIGGMVQDTIQGDGILVFDEAGNKIWDWNMFQVYDPMDDPDIMENKNDWGHANALNIMDDGNYIISFLKFDQIWKINSTTGELMWKLGLDGNFNMFEEDIFYKQHASHQATDGGLIIFDNGEPNKRPRSRLIKFNLNEEDLEASASLSVFLPDSLYSFKQGSAYEIENDKILFCIATNKRIAITDLTGKVLWQVISSNNYYRAEFIPESLFIDMQNSK